MPEALKLQEDYDNCFERLARMQGSDPAFFILAVHSFIERELRRDLNKEFDEEAKFSQMINEFREQLVSSKQNNPDLSILTPIAMQHKITNAARHNFQPARIEEAIASTHMLEKFCALARIPQNRALKKLCNYLMAWEERRSFFEVINEEKRANYKYEQKKIEAEKMAEKIRKYEEKEKLAMHLQEEIKIKDLKISQLEKTSSQKTQELATLKKERERLHVEYNAAMKEVAEAKEAKSYLIELTRMITISRTRTDYERTIIRLTPEQRAALSLISLNRDFFIKGAAGTGKTLVLLKAMEKAIGEGEFQALGMDEIKISAVLLTYSKTLAKYDRYLSSILNSKSACEIRTADSFLDNMLRKFEQFARIDYSDFIFKDFKKDYDLKDVAELDFKNEVENFIWANDISKDEYLNQGIERKGMKKPLGIKEREKIWRALEKLEDYINKRRKYPKNFARVKLYRYLTDEKTSCKIEKPDYIFVDEVQDLTSIELKCLKALSGRALIMAGDADQAIYQPGFSFRRAGIDISGNTRILKTNFRNTIEISQLTERYRLISNDSDKEESSDAFRNGPLPELFEASDAEELKLLAVERAEVLVEKIGMDPENIAIIAPERSFLESIQELLAARNLSSFDIHNEEYDFPGEGRIKLSTFHSAKGIDFPAVLILLPYLPFAGSNYEEVLQEKILRNLLYVSMSRAMDYLAVFVNRTIENPAVQDLVKVFKD